MIFIITLIISIACVYLCDNRKLLLSKSGDVHQNFIGTRNTPLVGGIVLFIAIFAVDIKELNFFLFFIFGILIVGIFSDTEKKLSPVSRLILQTSIIFISVYLFKNTISSTNLQILDNVLNYKFLSIFFTTFCILILVNGTNFIDGTNFNVIGYYLCIAIILLFFENFGKLNFLSINTLDLIIILLVLAVLNSLNRLYLGDSGSYLLGFIFGFELINYYNLNLPSPFFIILLLWYPCFELLFSIFRKINFNRSPLKPDSKHFHQLLYFFFNHRIKKPVLSSNLTGLIINFYNLTIFIIAMSDPSHTQLQIILILINLIIYSFIYLRLLKYRFKINF